jgi:uncharacterized membrane protein YphA (DoxX/SURF4 family)
MFSTFPDGWPSVGLLLLRVTCGAVLVAQGVACIGDKGQLGFFALGIAAAMIAVGVFLLVGFLTKAAAIVAAAAGVSGILGWLPGSNLGLLQTQTTAALAAVIGIAIICLGPGAISLDSRLFGRREVIIPTLSSKTDST